MNQWLPSYGAICWLSKILARFGRKKVRNEHERKTIKIQSTRIPLVSICILTRPKGSPKYRVTRTNIPRYYALNRPIRITSRLMLFSLRDLIFSFTDGLHIWTSTNCREKLGMLEKRFVWHNPSFFFKYYSMIFWIVDDTYIS